MVSYASFENITGLSQYRSSVTAEQVNFSGPFNLKKKTQYLSHVAV